MKKNKLIVLSMLMIPLILSGCNSRQELNTLGVVSSVVYDKKDDLVLVSTEIMNPGGAGKGDSGGEKKPLIIKSTGKSSPEALRKATDTLGRKLYVPHIRVRFFSEESVKEDMLGAMDFLLRDREIRQTAGMVVIRGDNHESLFEASVKPEDNLGVYVDKLLKSQTKETATSVYVDTLEFARDCYEDGKEPVASVVELIQSEEKKQGEGAAGGTGEGSGGGAMGGGDSGGGAQKGASDSEKYKLISDGFAVFKDNRLVGFMNGIEARAYNFITGNLKGAVVTLPFEEGNTVVDVQTATPSVKSQFKDGKAVIDLKLKVSIAIMQDTRQEDISKSEAIKRIEQRFKEVISEEITQTINKSQTQFQCDSYGFGEYVHIQNPKEWANVKDDWNRCFKDAQINVQVEAEVIRSGAFKQPFKLEF